MLILELILRAEDSNTLDYLGLGSCVPTLNVGTKSAHPKPHRLGREKDGPPKIPEIQTEIRSSITIHLSLYIKTETKISSLNLILKNERTVNFYI